MKKTLIAAALLAGFSGVAQAETQVTLYGLIDAGIGYQKIKTNGGDSTSKIGVNSGNQNGSRWGMRGTEDLGDGLRAVFTLEAGFNVENGRSLQGGRLFGRQSTVGLASDTWGQFDFGRQTNIASKYFATIDPFGAGFTQANIGAAFGAANTSRYDNMVLYQSANYSGFQFGAGYAFDASTPAGASYTNFATNQNQRAITSGIRYANGPLQVAVTYDQINQVSSLDAPRARSYNIGAAYDFQVVKIAAAFGQTRNGWFAGQAISSFDVALPGTTGLPSNVSTDDFRANSYMLGATLPIGGSSNLFGSWLRVDPTNANLTGGSETSNTYSLGYTYDLSKRTNLYAIASYATDFAFIDNQKSTLGLVGVRHRF